jgi:hypothetical protein
MDEILSKGRAGRVPVREWRHETLNGQRHAPFRLPAERFRKNFSRLTETLTAGAWVPEPHTSGHEVRRQTFDYCIPESLPYML